MVKALRSLVRARRTRDDARAVPLVRAGGLMYAHVVVFEVRDARAATRAFVFWLTSLGGCKPSIDEVPFHTSIVFAGRHIRDQCIYSKVPTCGNHSAASSTAVRAIPGLRHDGGGHRRRHVA